MEDSGKFEKSLMDYLSSAKLDRNQLRDYSSAIASLKKQGVVIEKIWKYGIPVIDGIIVRGRMPIKNSAKINKIMEVKKFRWCDIFPIGIPFPDILEIRIRVGEEVQQF